MAKREAETIIDTAGSAGTSARVTAEAAPHGHKPAGEPPHAAQPAKLARKTPISRYFMLLLLAGAAVWGGKTGYGWWTDGRFLVTTDDAYVAADITTLAAKASGYITEVLVADNGAVKAGDVIAHVDDGDYRIALRQAEAALAGLDASGFSAHSLRSGFVTEAAAQNIPMPETMALTGHRSPASVIGYFRQGEVLGLRAARLMEDNNAEPPEPKKQR